MLLKNDCFTLAQPGEIQNLSEHQVNSSKHWWYCRERVRWIYALRRSLALVRPILSRLNLGFWRFTLLILDELNNHYAQLAEENRRVFNKLQPLPEMTTEREWERCLSQARGPSTTTRLKTETYSQSRFPGNLSIPWFFDYFSFCPVRHLLCHPNHHSSHTVPANRIIGFFIPSLPYTLLYSLVHHYSTPF